MKSQEDELRSGGTHWQRAVSIGKIACISLLRNEDEAVVDRQQQQHQSSRIRVGSKNETYSSAV